MVLVRILFEERMVSACSRKDYPSNSHIYKGSNLMLQLFVFNVSSFIKVSIDVALSGVLV
jgi:hypothetical protein